MALIDDSSVCKQLQIIVNSALVLSQSLPWVLLAKNTRHRVAKQKPTFLWGSAQRLKLVGRLWFTRCGRDGERKGEITKLAVPQQSCRGQTIVPTNPSDFAGTSLAKSSPKNTRSLAALTSAKLLVLLKCESHIAIVVTHTKQRLQNSLNS